MLFKLNHSDHPAQRQYALRCWYLDNGLLPSQLVGPALVDTAARTVTVDTRVPVAGQEGRDSPEFVVDADGRPVSREQVVDLVVMPLPWMLTMTGAWPEPRRRRSPKLSLSLL